MFESLSKMCADNQATYDSIPQLRSRRLFSTNSGGHAMPRCLLSRKKGTPTACTLYASNPSKALATEPKAPKFTSRAHDFAPSTSKNTLVPTSLKSADQAFILHAFDFPSLQSNAPDSMQYDSGVASDTNSPIGAPSSPSLLHRHTFNSPAESLAESTEQMETTPLHETRTEMESSNGSTQDNLEVRQSVNSSMLPSVQQGSSLLQMDPAESPSEQHQDKRDINLHPLIEQSAATGTTALTTQTPELLPSMVQSIETSAALDEESSKQLCLDHTPSQTNPADTAPSSTTEDATTIILPDKRETTIKPYDDRAETEASPAHDIVSSGAQVPSDLNTAENSFELKERKATSHLFLEEKSGKHKHSDSLPKRADSLPKRADSLPKGANSLPESSISASLKSQGAQIALNMVVSITVVSLPSFHHTVMMGLLILAVCVFLYIMTLPKHTYARDFLAN